MQSSSSSVSSSLVAPASTVTSTPSSGLFDFDDFMVQSDKTELAEVSVKSELETEIEAFKALKPSDLSFGVVAGKFEPLVYWANPSVEKQFPRHSAVARSFFAARGSEDTSERTFSYATRQLSDLRANMDPAQVSASVSNHAAEKHHKIKTEEVWEKYKSQRGGGGI